MSVAVYTTPSCSYCSLVKSYLSKQGVSYSEYNVARDTHRAEEMVKKSGQMGVPVVDINGRIIVGFNKPEIERALRR